MLVERRQARVVVELLLESHGFAHFSVPLRGSGIRRRVMRQGLGLGGPLGAASIRSMIMIVHGDSYDVGCFGGASRGNYLCACL